MPNSCHGGTLTGVIISFVCILISLTHPVLLRRHALRQYLQPESICCSPLFTRHTLLTHLVSSKKDPVTSPPSRQAGPRRTLRTGEVWVSNRVSSHLTCTSLLPWRSRADDALSHSHAQSYSPHSPTSSRLLVDIAICPA